MTLKPVRSELLEPLAHGFFTRKGGVSEHLFASLNCGERSNDHAGNVQENRRRVANALRISPARLLTCTQKHAADIAVITELPLRRKPVADGLVTNLQSVAIGILTADCQPILLADREAGIVGAVHAGWPGTLQGVIENAVLCMERIGALRSRIAAVIGPTISRQNYEVGPEFRERFVATDNRSERHFDCHSQGRFTFDLPAYGCDILQRSGVGVFEWSGHCTYASADSFFSYRRSVHRKEAEFGLMISAIAIP